MREMQYQACPKEPWCGEYLVNLPADGKDVKIRPQGDSEYIFFGGALCTYSLQFPEGAAVNDKIRVTLTSAYRTKAYFLAT